MKAAIPLLLALPLAAAEPAEIQLWPDGAPDEPADFNPQVKPDTEERISLVRDPSITVMPAPADKTTGAGVLVCPGGGYHILAWPKEGLEVGEWLNSIGVHAYILKYRVPRRAKDDAWKWPLQDAQRALRLIRHRADRWNQDPERLGILGFSAGGHLSIVTSLIPEGARYEAIDAADELSARPNFALPIYAAYITGGKGDAFGPEIKLTEDSPPMFFAVTQDDKTRGADAARMFIRMTELGVPAEAHLYTHGGHGYGLRPSADPVHRWPEQAAAWMKRMGLLEPDSP